MSRGLASNGLVPNVRWKHLQSQNHGGRSVIQDSVIQNSVIQKSVGLWRRRSWSRNLDRGALIPLLAAQDLTGSSLPENHLKKKHLKNWHHALLPELNYQKL